MQFSNLLKVKMAKKTKETRKERRKKITTKIPLQDECEAMAI